MRDKINPPDFFAPFAPEPQGKTSIKRDKTCPTEAVNSIKNVLIAKEASTDNGRNLWGLDLRCRVCR